MTGRRCGVLAAMAVVLGLAAAREPAPAPAAAAKVVGTVTSVNGPAQLQVRVGTRLRPLRRGATLRLGQVVVVGRRARATLRLRRPSGVPVTRDLVRFTPGRGARPRIRVSRSGRVTTVRIAPGR
jgi:hypothetical protein